MVIIRAATPGDVDSLVELHSEFRNSLQRTIPTETEFRTSIKLLIDTSAMRYILACDDHQPIGYLAQRYFNSTWACGKEALIEDLYVSEKYRNKGIGKMLVKQAIRDAIDHQCKSMFLDTNENNISSNALYKALGFKCERVRWNGGRQIRYDLPLVRI